MPWQQAAVTRRALGLSMRTVHGSCRSTNCTYHEVQGQVQSQRIRSMQPTLSDRGDREAQDAIHRQRQLLLLLVCVRSGSLTAGRPVRLSSTCRSRGQEDTRQVHKAVCCAPLSGQLCERLGYREHTALPSPHADTPSVGHACALLPEYNGSRVESRWHMPDQARPRTTPAVFISEMRPALRSSAVSTCCNWRDASACLSPASARAPACWPAALSA